MIRFTRLFILTVILLGMISSCSATEQHDSTDITEDQVANHSETIIGEETEVVESADKNPDAMWEGQSWKQLESYLVRTIVEPEQLTVRLQELNVQMECAFEFEQPNTLQMRLLLQNEAGDIWEETISGKFVLTQNIAGTVQDVYHAELATVNILDDKTIAIVYPDDITFIDIDTMTEKFHNLDLESIGPDYRMFNIHFNSDVGYLIPIRGETRDYLACIDLNGKLVSIDPLPQNYWGGWYQSNYIEWLYLDCVYANLGETGTGWQLYHPDVSFQLLTPEKTEENDGYRIILGKHNAINEPLQNLQGYIAILYDTDDEYSYVQFLGPNIILQDTVMNADEENLQFAFSGENPTRYVNVDFTNHIGYVSVSHNIDALHPTMQISPGKRFEVWASEGGYYSGFAYVVLDTLNESLYHLGPSSTTGSAAITFLSESTMMFSSDAQHVLFYNTSTMNIEKAVKLEDLDNEYILPINVTYDPVKEKFYTLYAAYNGVRNWSDMRWGTYQLEVFDRYGNHIHTIYTQVDVEVGKFSVKNAWISVSNGKAYIEIYNYDERSDEPDYVIELE